MNPRTLVAVGTVLVLAALGGFYFALSPRSGGLTAPLAQTVLPPSAAVTPMAAVPSTAAVSSGAAVAPPAAVPSSAVVSSSAAAPPAPPQPPEPAAPPPLATSESIEAEVALSEYAEVLALVKKSFASEYSELMIAAARRRNEGVSDQVFGRELAAGVQDIMRGKLQYGVGASMPTMDRLAANEASLFHTLGTEGAGFCHRMLGMDDSSAAGLMPENVRRLMQRGTLYRFQAIAEGMPDAKPAVPLSKDELRAFEASVSREGLNFKDVNSGAFLKASAEPGKPCLTLETLHLAIARLADDTRRKIYAGMFFLGRNR